MARSPGREGSDRSTGPSRMHIVKVEVDSTTIRVATRGYGPPLVLLNGFGANIEMWAPFQSLLTDRRIVMFDAPGTGESPPLHGPRRMRALARLLGRVLDKLGIGEADILGYSWGRALAHEFAHRAGDRVRSLVLVSTIYGVGGPPPSLGAVANLLTTKRYSSYAHLEKVAPRLYGGPTGRHPAAAAPRPTPGLTDPRALLATPTSCTRSPDGPARHGYGHCVTAHWSSSATTTPSFRCGTPK